jgi:hypothetical protein
VGADVRHAHEWFIKIQPIVLSALASRKGE